MRSWTLAKTILIEGNIAVGKSTIMSHIASTYPSSRVQVHSEPVDNWMNIKGFDLLKALYTESSRWSFAFELTALLSRIKNHTNAVSNRLHIYERSILSCFHVFTRYALVQKHLTGAEYHILRDHFQYGLTKNLDLSTTSILYFDLPAKQSFDRLTKRSRQAESTVQYERIEQLKHFYDDFIRTFDACPIQIIDASQPVERVCAQVDSLLKECLKHEHLIPSR